jgi:hypothetical protein
VLSRRKLLLKSSSAFKPCLQVTANQA